MFFFFTDIRPERRIYIIDKLYHNRYLEITATTLCSDQNFFDFELFIEYKNSVRENHMINLESHANDREGHAMRVWEGHAIHDPGVGRSLN